jgi:hypothetical protein
MQPLWPRPLIAQETCKAQLLSQPLLTRACTMATACTRHTVVTSSMQRHFCMRIDGVWWAPHHLFDWWDKKGEGPVNKTRSERSKVSVKIFFFSSSMHSVVRSFFRLHARLHADCPTKASAAIFWSRLRKPRRRSSGRARDFYALRVVHGILRQRRRVRGVEFMTWPCEVWLAAGERRQQSCLFAPWTIDLKFHTTRLRRRESKPVA